MTFLDRIKSLFGNEPDKLFYPGQEITPISSPTWAEQITRKPAAGPKFGEVVRVKGYVELHNNQWYIAITGYKDFYNEKEFAPVISDDQLEEMLNGIDELMIVQKGWS